MQRLIGTRRRAMEARVPRTRLGSPGRLASAAALACLALGCSGISTGFDYDPKADFTGFHGWDWAPGATGSVEAAGRVHEVSPLVDERIRAAIERELAAKGYRRVAGGTPDFRVGYGVSLKTEMDVRTLHDYYGYGYGGWGRRWGAYGPVETEVVQYEVGTLVIDVIAAGSNDLVWRGYATGRLSEHPTPEETTENVNEAVHGILEPFPP